jgi:hypothetical protein
MKAIKTEYYLNPIKTKYLIRYIKKYNSVI